MRTGTKRLTAGLIAACMGAGLTACNNVEPQETRPPIYVEEAVYETEITTEATEEPEPEPIELPFLGDIEKKPLKGDITQINISIASEKPVKAVSSMITNSELKSRKDNCTTFVRASSTIGNLIDRAVSVTDYYPKFKGDYEIYGDYLENILFTFSPVEKDTLYEEQQTTLYTFNQDEISNDNVSIDGMTVCVDYADIIMRAEVTDCEQVSVHHSNGMRLTNLLEDSPFKLTVDILSEDIQKSLNLTRLTIEGKLLDSHRYFQTLDGETFVEVPEEEPSEPVRTGLTLSCNNGVVLSADATHLFSDLVITFLPYGAENEVITDNLVVINTAIYDKEEKTFSGAYYTEE